MTGTGAIIISPTRELSLQIYGVLRDLMENAAHIQTHGLVMGGEQLFLPKLLPPNDYSPSDGLCDHDLTGISKLQFMYS